MRESTHNPLRANPVKIVKSVLRTTYEANREKYDSEYEYNVDNDSDHNEYYTVLTHKEKGREQGLLIREQR